MCEFAESKVFMQRNGKKLLLSRKIVKRLIVEDNGDRHTRLQSIATGYNWVIKVPFEEFIKWAQESVVSSSHGPAMKLLLPSGEIEVSWRKETSQHASKTPQRLSLEYSRLYLEHESFGCYTISTRAETIEASYVSRLDCPGYPVAIYSGNASIEEVQDICLEHLRETHGITLAEVA